MPGTRRRMRGRGWFTDIFTKTIPNAAKSAYNYVKRKPLSSISGALSMIPSPVSLALKGVSAVGGLAGLGRRRRVRRKRAGRRQRGGAGMELVRAGHQFPPRSSPYQPPSAAPEEKLSYFQRFKNFLKRHQVLSRGARFLSGYVPHAGLKSGLSTAANVAGALGYGRRRKRTRVVKRRKAHASRRVHGSGMSGGRRRRRVRRVRVRRPRRQLGSGPMSGSHPVAHALVRF